MTSQDQFSTSSRRDQELIVLDRVGQAMTATLDLEHLLETIHQQLAQLLQVNNFYVALYDPQEDTIWYPLAVKDGQRMSWPKRPLEDRLTDRVILQGKPILLPNRGRERLAQLGLAAGKDAPHAWIGVPLISSRQTIGCLALFSQSRKIEFNEADLKILSILSGQIAVAIEVALRNASLAGALLSGTDRLAAVLNSVDEGILLIERDGQITLANRAIQEMAGYAQRDFLGKMIQDLPSSVQDCLGYPEEMPEDMPERARLVPLPGPDKKLYPVGGDLPPRFLERSIHPFRNQAGEEIGWLVVLRDLTEEQQAKKARDLVNETLIHDLRSPVSAVLTALDVIEDALGTADPGEIVLPSLQIAKRSAQRVLGLIESMLEMARFQAGKIELHLAATDMAVLIEQILAEFARRASDYGVTLEVDLPPDLPEVMLDENIITRVIANLVDNALKFASAPGHIQISAGEVAGGRVEVQVRDSGPGIPAEYQEKIFERFGQIPGQAGRTRGSGLGLAYCRMAVEAHGGRIRVESTPGSGSTFSFFLPIYGNLAGHGVIQAQSAT